MKEESLLTVHSYIIGNDMIAHINELINEFGKDGKTPFPDQKLNEIISEAEKLLGDHYSVSSKRSELCWQDVFELGRPAGMESEERKDYIRAAASQLGAALGGQQTSFALRFSTLDKPVFSIGVTKDRAETPKAALRAACKYVRVGEGKPSELPPGFFRSKAVGRFIFMDLSDSEKKLDTETVTGWPDKVAAAFPDKRCYVEIRFDCADRELLRSQLKAIYDLIGLLERYSEMPWQVAGNVGTGVADKNSIVVETINTITGNHDDNYSLGTNVSLSQTFHLPQAEMLAEKLKYQASRIRQMLRDSAHFVTVFTAAEDKMTLNALQSVLSGALAGSSLSLRWESISREPDSAFLIPDHALDLIVAIPGEDFPNFSILELGEYDLNAPTAQPSLLLGQVIWNETELKTAFTIPLGELNRHAFICGMTGSGKTNTVCHLLTEIEKPFLVIEPVKGEYRSLRGGTKRPTEVYSMDVRGGELLSVNPLWFPMGASLQYHIDSIKTIISSAFDLYAAMPNILEQCLLNTYVHAGWNLVTSRNLYEGKLPDDTLYPTISDLCDEIEYYLNNSEFEGEAKANYKGALLSRLRSFTSGAKGILLNRPVHLPFDRWLSDGFNIVLELDAVADDADKCIVMGTILTQYFQFVKYCYRGADTKGLRHILVLEEAHHLFARSDKSDNGSNAREQLSEFLSNMLAEIRAYGEGIMIVDQSPSRISPEIIKNTAVKIVHRVDYGEDLEILRAALLLKEHDRTPARLGAGQALVRCGSMRKAAMVYVPVSNSKENYSLLNKSYSDSVSEDCLIRSTIDTILRNENFRIKLVKVCEMFANQAVFDGRPGVQNSIYMLWKHVYNLLHEHGYSELTREYDTVVFVRRLVITGLHLALRTMYPEQSYLCGIIELYLERLIILLTSTVMMREKEWKVFCDYRTRQIHERVSQFYTCSHKLPLVRLRRVCGTSKYLGLTAMILFNRKDEIEQEFLSLRRNGESVQLSDLRELTGKKLQRCFYLVPERDVVDTVCALIQKYLRLMH